MWGYLQISWILTALETSSFLFDHLEKIPLKMRQGSIRSDFPSLLADQSAKMSKESGPKVPIFQAPKVETAAVFGWSLLGEDKVIPLSSYLYVYIYIYSSWKVHGTVPTYWFTRDPLPNLPFGICAIYFDLKVYPMTFLQLATILTFAKAFNFFRNFPNSSMQWFFERSPASFSFTSSFSLLSLLSLGSFKPTKGVITGATQSFTGANMRQGS